MRCLHNYIGVKGCSDVVPDGGYVHQLPGLTSEAFDKIANSDQKTYVGVFNDVQASSISSFRTALTAKLAERYKINTLNQSIEMSRYLNSDIHTADTKYRGVLLNSNSVFNSFYIHSISIHCGADVSDVEVVAIDVRTGDKLWTKNVQLEEGWNNIMVKDLFHCGSLFVAYDSTNIDSHSITVGGEEDGCSAPINTPDLITVGSDTYGMSLIYSRRCTFDALVCNNIDLFGQAYKMLFAATYCSFRIHSKRSNLWTLDIESAKELKDYYDAEFDKEIERSVAGVTLNISDGCIACGDTITRKWMLP